MKNMVRTLSITAALAVMIPFSAYAATSVSDSSSTKNDGAAWTVNGGSFENRGGPKSGRGVVSQEVLDLLKLDKAAFNEKIKAGSTLAQIAEEQGVSRDTLKNAMTDAFNKKLEERKQDFSDNLDKIIDSTMQVDKHEGWIGGVRVKQDMAAVAVLLGLSADEVKEQLQAGKSLADIAADKGVDVQKLIDAQTAALTSSINEAVKSGKLTQEQADKQLANVADLAEKMVNGKGFGGDRHPGEGHRGKDRGAVGESKTSDTAKTESVE